MRVDGRLFERSLGIMIRSAWFLCLTAGSFLLGGIGLCAAESDDNPLTGHLIECGTDKVVLFRHPASPNRRYAVGWTLRKNGKESKPVDWTKWNPDESANAFLKDYNFLDPEIVGGGAAPLVD